MLGFKNMVCILNLNYKFIGAHIVDIRNIF